MHCKQLFSHSGASKHSKLLKSDRGINLGRLFSIDKIDLYKSLIMEDVAYLSENGKLNLFRSNDSARSVEGDDNQIIQNEDPPQVDETATITQDFGQEERPCPNNEMEQEFPEQDPTFEEEWDCVEDFLLSDLSCVSCFNCEKLFERAALVLNGLSKDEQKKNLMKSRIVTLFLRQLSTLLSLSKSQNNKMWTF